MSKNDEFETKEEMSKEELVYVMCIMMNCVSHKAQINKLSKACLFRLFDDMASRGNNFTNLESNVREEQHRNIELQGKIDKLERDYAALFKKLQNEVRKNNKEQR